MQTDKNLLDEIGNKNPEAFRLFYVRHSRFVLRRIKSLVGDDDMANDFIQEFWMNLWEKPSILKTNENGSAFNFLYSFLFTFVLLTRRRYARHQDRVINLSEIRNTPDSFHYSHVLEEIEMHELLEFIEAITEDFTDADQLIYKLYEQNYSHARIADELSLSEGTVRNRLTRILRAIREGVQDQYLSEYLRIPTGL